MQGDDLAVRDGEVFLKTLTGLERVAAIFRRVDSDFCDPLEFRGDSALGVPGLVEAVRAGGVVLANALGGGVIESPAMDAYLPAMCARAAGRRPENSRHRHHLVRHRMGPQGSAGAAWTSAILRDAFDARPLFSRNSSARLGADMSARGTRARHRAASKQRGETMVLQEISPLGVAPVFEQGSFGAKPVSLRVFAAWTPNGLDGDAGRADPRRRRRHGARACPCSRAPPRKDAWVISDAPVDNFSLLANGGRSAGNQAPGRIRAQPRHGQSVLAGPLCRAHRKLCAHPARGDGAAERRAGQRRWTWRASC